jgi:hypothetical protein
LSPGKVGSPSVTQANAVWAGDDALKLDHSSWILVDRRYPNSLLIFSKKGVIRVSAIIKYVD